MWTSENADDRATAARWCVGCQVSDLCADAAEERGEKWASGQASIAPPSADHKEARKKPRFFVNGQRDFPVGGQLISLVADT